MVIIYFYMQLWQKQFLENVPIINVILWNSTIDCNIIKHRVFFVFRLVCKTCILKIGQVKQIHAISQGFIHQTFVFHAVSGEFWLKVRLDYSKVNLLQRTLTQWASLSYFQWDRGSNDALLSWKTLLDSLKAWGFTFMEIIWIWLKVKWGYLQWDTWGWKLKSSSLMNCKEPAPRVLRSESWTWLISPLPECNWGKSPYLSECQFS